MKLFKAIAAMSLNRVVGAGNKTLWHLSEDYKCLSQISVKNVVVMCQHKRQSPRRGLIFKTKFMESTK